MCTRGNIHSFIVQTAFYQNKHINKSALLSTLPVARAEYLLDPYRVRDVSSSHFLYPFPFFRVSSDYMVFPFANQLPWQITHTKSMSREILDVSVSLAPVCMQPWHHTLHTLTFCYREI